MKKKAPLKGFDETLRPVSARALKSVRDTLRPHFFGADILDLYCGSGRFGLGALEEGAKSGIFVDRNKKSLDRIEKEAAKHAWAATVRGMECFCFLQSVADTPRRYDIVFADPPFSEWSEEFAARLVDAVAKVVAPGSIFLVKRPSRMVACPANSGFSVWKETKFGESTLDYLEYGSEG